MENFVRRVAVVSYILLRDTILVVINPLMELNLRRFMPPPFIAALLSRAWRSRLRHGRTIRNLNNIILRAVHVAWYVLLFIFICTTIGMRSQNPNPHHNAALAA